MAIYRFDPVSRISWLEFDGKPEQAIIDLLKKEGWRWAGYRKQWHTNRRFAQVPEGIEFEDGGECDYSSERSERLQNASVRASERSETAYERSNELVDGIPLGQPIISGTRSGRQHQKTLEKSRNAMETSAKEEKKADWLEQKAKSSAIHQAYKERPDVIHRRIKRLKGEITSLQNSHRQGAMFTVSEFKYGSITKEQAKEKIAASKKWVEERKALLEAEIAENEQGLQEAGGLIADSLDIQIGDVIRGRWQGLNEVTKINKRSGEILSYTCRPLENTWCSKYVIPKDQVREVAVRKGNVSSEALLEAKHEGKSYTPKQEEEPKREFKVQEVEVVNIYNNTTSVFLTPAPLADELARGIPSDAHLILEPSAGVGTIADAVRKQRQDVIIHCCEILPQFRGVLEKRGFHVVGENFLEYNPVQSNGRKLLYNAIIANPPFNNTEWLDHIEHMLELLKPGGRLIAILPSGFAFREDKRIKAFRELVEEHGYWQELPRETFVESGTNVSTVMVTMQKPTVEQEEVSIAQQVSLW